MPLTLTPEQLEQLRQMGINLPESVSNVSLSSKGETAKPRGTLSSESISEIPQSNTNNIINGHISPPSSGQISPTPILSTHTNQLLNTFKSPLFPLFSISGLTIISFGGLFLLKSRQSAPPISPAVNNPTVNSPQVTPTQVPKSIQHYLLTSQQQFTEALQYQSTDTTKAVELINQSILTASEAVKAFPDDYRGYEQRGRIYLSLLDSQAQLLDPAISDFSLASKLNPSSPDITRSLAGLFARKGDAQTTLILLAQTVTLEPTRAQNFYDLARLQQQTGLLPQALETYNRLLTLISDPAQKEQVVTEKTAVEKLVAQAPNGIKPSNHPSNTEPVEVPTPTGGINLPDSPKLIQATLIPTGSPFRSSEGTQEGLIIAAPETSKDLKVTNLTDSNALSGNSILPSNTAQVTIDNDNLTPDTQVYLTVTKGGKNQTLQVLSRSAKSFTVGLNSAISEPIEFKWWIVK
jgi:hypothetical protein